MSRNMQGDEGDMAHLESRFECPICLTWLRDPVLTSCGHKFCSQCINNWLRKKGASCPIDSKPLKPDSDLFRDLFTSREISQQRTNCPYQRYGCTVELSPIEMETHANECSRKKESSADSREIKCPFRDVGCADDFELESDMRQHLEKSINLHLTMMGAAVSRLTAQSRTGMTSTTATEAKWWDPPPKNAAATSNGEGRPPSPPPDWQQLLRSLYERIVVLEQQNRELSIALSNQQNRLTSLQTSVRFDSEEMSLRYSNGVYIWRLSSFEEKLTAMTNESQKMFYSPGFYTSPYGYKICARMNVFSKNRQHLSVLVHMMRSENDDALDWPFNGMITFALIHPSDPEKNIRESTKSNPNLEAFRRPICELNRRSFGYTEFVPVEKLTEFTRNDQLILKIEVRSM